MPEEGLGGWEIIIFLVVIFAIMYFLMIRPRQKQQKKHDEMMSELRRGDKVIIAGGIYGEIESLSEDTAIIILESGATMKVARSSILGKEGATESGGGGGRGCLVSFVCLIVLSYSILIVSKSLASTFL
jgi:preprotein translocase subunit YajC